MITLKSLSGSGRIRRPLRMREFTPAVISEVEKIFMSVPIAWRNNMKSITSQYERLELIKDASQMEASSAIERTSIDISNTIIYQTERLGRWVTRAGELHGAAFIRAAKSAVGVDVSPYLRLEEVQPQLEAFLREGAARIGGLNSELRARVESLVFRAFAERWTKRKLVVALAELTDTTQKRARLRARDFASGIQSVLDEYRFTQFGLPDYIWRTMHDDRVRALHRTRDGKTFSWNKPPEDGHAGRPPGCRCRPEAVLW